MSNWYNKEKFWCIFDDNIYCINGCCQHCEIFINRTNAKLVQSIERIEQKQDKIQITIEEYINEQKHGK